ncbi:hypothetical protein GIB67_022714 [Kingdonia uniflora]|uniref:Uncharacterized protein n=1 Tax=Kingdonia uniflora TaxID=39325 RepID=A0A7J7P8U9_9MAGN|nr:hypothetical protein GIB67_022714 [Kingdonia uniflora]
MMSSTLEGPRHIGRFRVCRLQKLFLLSVIDLGMVPLIVLLILRRMKKSDGTLTGDVVPYNIVPLDAPALTYAIGSFAEKFPEHPNQ